MKDGGKEIYEALQAVNACLDETGEQLLVDLVEKIRTQLRDDFTNGYPAHGGMTEAVLHRWIQFDAAIREEPPVRRARYHDPYRGIQIGDGNNQVNNF